MLAVAILLPIALAGVVAGRVGVTKRVIRRRES
jgi:hypothetical protein